MKKNKLYLFASTVGLLGLMTAGCSNNQTATKSNNSVKTSQSSTKNSVKSTKSESNVTSSSSTAEIAHNKDSQNNNQTDLSSISDKVVGVLAYAVARPTNLSDLGNGGFYYGTAYNYPDTAPEIRGDNYINAGGNDEFDVWFKRNGDNISVSILDTANAPSSAEAKIKTTNYSLKQLVKRYYNTPDQKAQVDGYANALKDRN